MPITLALLLAAAQFAPDQDLPLELDGECIYPPTLAEAARGDGMVLCDRVVADGEGIEFRQRQWNAGFRFFGTWQGDQMQVTQIRGRTGPPVEARGLCRIYYANDEISMISCTSVASGRSWIANFRKSRI